METLTRLERACSSGKQGLEDGSTVASIVSARRHSLCGRAPVGWSTRIVTHSGADVTHSGVVGEARCTDKVFKRRQRRFEMLLRRSWIYRFALLAAFVLASGAGYKWGT